MSTTTTFHHGPWLEVQPESAPRACWCGMDPHPCRACARALEPVRLGIEWRRLERSWVRVDSNGDHPHTRDRGDVSPSHVGYPRGYDSACGWCYLGAQHTADEHAREVGA